MPKVRKREVKRAAKNSEVKIEMSAMPVTTIHFSAEFSPGRFLVYCRFNERDLVHVREYALSEEGQTYPTKKGVCLTPTRLKALTNNIEDIDEHLKQLNADAIYKVQQEQYKVHLGGGIYVSVDAKFSGVDLRRYWMPETQGSVVPTKSGIYLTSAQWSALKGKIDELLSAHPELGRAEICFHQNQIGMMDCSECMPFGWAI